MSLIMAAESDGNADVENGKYISAMSKIVAVDSDGNAGVENGKH